jgi:CheY-like chemotaxis protein
VINASWSCRVRVLVVEDVALLALMLADELTESGHEVIGPASTSREAIRLAEMHHPTFAFVDLDLEEKAIGLDVTERLTADMGVNVIICTGQPGVARRAQSGAIGLLKKPYGPEEAATSLAIAEAVVRGTGSPKPLPPSFELLVSPQ